MRCRQLGRAMHELCGFQYRMQDPNAQEEEDCHCWREDERFG